MRHKAFLPNSHIRNAPHTAKSISATHFVSKTIKLCGGGSKAPLTAMMIKHLPLVALALMGSLTAAAQNTKRLTLPISQNPSMLTSPSRRQYGPETPSM